MGLLSTCLADFERNSFIFPGSFAASYGRSGNSARICRYKMLPSHFSVLRDVGRVRQNQTVGH